MAARSNAAARQSMAAVNHDEEIVTGKNCHYRLISVGIFGEHYT